MGTNCYIINVAGNTSDTVTYLTETPKPEGGAGYVTLSPLTRNTDQFFHILAV